MNFKDYFSLHASSYAAFRPKSPTKLFSYLASLVSRHELAWDAGTGNGQAALELTNYFENVIATDASEEQLKYAGQHPKITYKHARVEDCGIDSGAVNLITAAQAVHWFDFDKFYAEVLRVAAQNAVIAVWTYELAFISPEIDKLCRRYYLEDTGKYWPAERKFVDDHYRAIPFPFREIESPAFEMTEHRNLSEWCGYIYTWSATQRAIKEEGIQLFENFASELEKLWGDPEKKLTVKWPMYLRVGYV